MQLEGCRLRNHTVLPRSGADALPASANLSLSVRGNQQYTTAETSSGKWKESCYPDKSLLWHGGRAGKLTGEFALVQKCAKQTSCRAYGEALPAVWLGILFKGILSKHNVPVPGSA